MIRLNKKLNVYAAITILALLIFSGLNTKRPEQTYAAGTYTTSLPSTINVTPLSDNGIRPIIHRLIHWRQANDKEQIC